MTQWDSLIGDLEEQRARGRSSFWYWRQVLAAALLGAVADIRDHKLAAFRSAVITWAISIAWVELTLYGYIRVGEKWVYGWVNSSTLLFEFWIPFSGGLCLVWCAGAALCGWLVARGPSTTRRAKVVASAVALVPGAFWWSRIVWIFMNTRYPLRNLHLTVPNYLQAFVIIVGMPLCVLLAGLQRSGDAEGTTFSRAPCPP